MIRQILHSVLSFVLAVLLIFGSASKEFIHLFASHEDTVHIHDAHDGLSFENEHHHCTFLSFALPPFLNDVGTFTLKQPQEYNTNTTAVRVVHLIPRTVTSSFLRGPPVAV
ncbi:MAG: hypothetical protein H6551_06880 [Chitinophagales bacterium]|nr:hypothetical protein [Chitinophagaceae bacterium]MCB9064855.1 hypothetical protein [Chitinophagales bacterium]